MSKVINFVEIRDKLFSKLEGTGWAEPLRFFIRSSDFVEILEKLHYEVEEGRRFSPALKDMFKPFQNVHLKDVKVVFLFNEGYLNPILNTGIPLQFGLEPRPPLPLYRLQEGLVKEYPGTILPIPVSRWMEQGVILLNLSLTSQIGKTGRHNEIWAQFSSLMLKTLVEIEPVFVVFGENKLAKNLTNSVRVRELPQDREGKWESKGMFKEINEKLISKNLLPIVW